MPVTCAVLCSAFGKRSWRTKCEALIHFDKGMSHSISSPVINVTLRRFYILSRISNRFSWRMSNQTWSEGTRVDLYLRILKRHWRSNWGEPEFRFQRRRGLYVSDPSCWRQLLRCRHEPNGNINATCRALCEPTNQKANWGLSLVQERDIVPR
jgi:hypothetical protein